MDEQPSYKSSYETLMKLINDIKVIRKPERDIFFHSPNAWGRELSLHPERFRMENDELLYLGVRVGIVSSTLTKRKERKFWRMVNRCVADGVISKND